jgi:hypothetical protein
MTPDEAALGKGTETRTRAERLPIEDKGKVVGKPGPPYNVTGTDAL